MWLCWVQAALGVQVLDDATGDDLDEVGGDDHDDVGGDHDDAGDNLDEVGDDHDTGWSRETVNCNIFLTDLKNTKNGITQSFLEREHREVLVF